jgi:hypothetical protein
MKKINLLSGDGKIISTIEIKVTPHQPTILNCGSRFFVNTDNENYIECFCMLVPHDISEV